MPETTITRSQIIVVNEVGENAYKDLTFTDKEGGEYKVNTKRRQYFEKVIVPSMAVKLNFAMAYNKEYIYSAVQVKDALPPPTPHELAQKISLEKAKADAREPVKLSSPKQEPVKDNWTEKDRITRKSIERQTSLNAAVEIAKQVSGVVTTEKILATAKVFEAYLEGKEVQPLRKSLVEEAKKLGATEIRKEDEN